MAACLALGACARAPVGDFSPEDRADYARAALARARALRAEGDLVKAERIVRSAVAVDPENRRARSLQIEILDALGREEEAAQGRRELARRASAALPDGPALPSRGLFVAISATSTGPGSGPEAAQAAALVDPFAATLAERVGVRLPEAVVTRRVPATVAEGRAWLEAVAPRAALGLLASRAFCGESAKDGSFAVAELVAHAGAAGAPPLERIEHVERIFDPERERCIPEVAARAFEVLLEDPELRERLAGAPAPGPAPWPAASVRAVFASLDASIEEQLAAAREHLLRGRTAEALAALREAARLDPEDPAAAVLRAETEAALAMQEELRAAPGSFVAEAASAAPGTFVAGAAPEAVPAATPVP